MKERNRAGQERKGKEGNEKRWGREKERREGSRTFDEESRNQGLSACNFFPFFSKWFERVTFSVCPSFASALTTSS